MFTGIVEEIAEVKKIIHKGNTLQLTFAARVILLDVKLGDSISVNGVCLTVVTFDNNTFTVDVMPVTYNITTLHLLTIGSKVNCERAMAANSRFGGHFVAGHIDGVGNVVSRHQVENAVIYKISFAPDLMDMCTEKGSIAIDGTSLTIFKINDNDSIEVSLVPHTQEKSVIAHKQAGDKVNIEIDMLAKQVKNSIAKMMNKNSQSENVSYEFLRNNGYA